MDLSEVKKKIDSITHLPEEEWDHFLSIVSVRYASKCDYLLKQGDVCRHIYYMLSGGVRVFYETDSGKEVISNFLFENNVVTSYASFFTRTPSLESIRVIENAEILVITYEQFHAIMMRNYAWISIFHRIMTRYFLHRREWEEIILMEDYVKRFEKVFSNRPHLFQRVPQKMIASYLGMTPETLSRVKRIWSLS
jgi:CRP-like cAMP-binding protein